MADRYERLYKSEKELYFVGTQLVLSACALLRDNMDNSLVAQLKLKNIGAKPIKAVSVELTTYDTAERPLGETIRYTFLDLNAKRDEFFGTQTAIPLSDNNTRSFFVKITEVILSDNTILTNLQNKCVELPKPLKLTEAYKLSFTDPELFEQYKKKTSRFAIYKPFEFEDIWFCSCGAINSENESVCHSCIISFQAQKDALDLKTLAEELKERRSQELYAKKMSVLDKAVEYMNSDTIEGYENALNELSKIKGFENADELSVKCLDSADELRKKKAAEEKRRQQELQRKKRKKTIIVTVSSIAVVLIVTFFALLDPVIIPAVKYHNANTLYEQGKYNEALTIYSRLGFYLDSQYQMQKCNEAITWEQYKNAISLYDRGRYEEAIVQFEKLDSLYDSKEQIRKCKSAMAEKLMEEEKYSDAIVLFREVGNGEKADECKELLNEKTYEEAKTLYKEKDYIAAHELLLSLEDYKNSVSLAK